jgi:adenine-specific DNA-methyltransferase
VLTYGAGAVEAVRWELGESPISDSVLPNRVSDYPEFRYMGSKHRLLPWIYSVLRTLPFETAADPFVGSGSVSYLLKAMGKKVTASDFLNFPAVIAEATLANSTHRVNRETVEGLISDRPNCPDFIARTFSGVFYTIDDLQFLDRVSANIEMLPHPHERAVARAALIRSCLKKQPRGVFTVSGDLSRYDDGRRDLRLSMEEHFREQIGAFNRVVFDNGRENIAIRRNVFELETSDVDLVYLDPPYVPRSDDNCYIKRYHFVEGLSCYWQICVLWKILKSKKSKKLKRRLDTVGQLFLHSTIYFLSIIIAL